MKPTLSIGIAAYNEEQNIGHLLKALSLQQIGRADLREIIVVSDCSSDRTDEIVRSSGCPKARLVRHPERRGGAEAQNTIAENAVGDILVVLDADIIPEDQRMIDALIAPIVDGSDVGLTSCVITPAEPRSFVEKSLARNHLFKDQLWLSAGKNDSIYTCYGPARAFARALYATMRYPNDVPADAYSYMHCIKQGMRFVTVRDTSVVFRCPENFRDHRKQSSRFLSGKESIIDIFGAAAEASYDIPRSVMMRACLREALSHPLCFAGFTLMSIRIRLARKRAFAAMWEMAATSKSILS